MSLLSIEGLRLRFRGEARPAVDGVSLEVAAGETVALVGESGSGKTMTALSVPRLGPETALETAEGTVRFGGADVLALDRRGVRALRGARIGMVFQDPSAALDPIMTVGRQIAEAVRGAATVEGLLDEVGLAHLPGIARRYPHELSGGQQQRVGIAMALAGDPELLVADEPTTALDVTIQAQILDLLQVLRDRRGMALLIISHDFGVVARLAQRIVVMRHGQIVEAGATAAILQHPQDPYTRALLACRPGLDDPPDRLPTLSGTPDALPAPALGAPILEVEHLRVRYPARRLFDQPVTAVDGVSLTVRAGEAVGLVGESGSGKSSLAKALVGLAPIAGGRIRLDGRAVLALTRADRRTVQYIFQDSFGSLNPRHRVAEILTEPLMLHDIAPPAERPALVDRLLGEVGLGPEHRDRLPAELSGGQRQRVAIARALALEPRLLICDEIVSALDVSVQAQILNLLKDLMARRGLALIFISHDLAVVRFIADAVIVMKDGVAVEAGPAGRVAGATPQTYTKSLVAAARALETGR